jgi:hypothetical protein
LLEVAASVVSASPWAARRLIQTTAGVVATPLKVVQPSLLHKNLSGEIKIGGHVALFCKTDRRHATVRLVR